MCQIGLHRYPTLATHTQPVPVTLPYINSVAKTFSSEGGGNGALLRTEGLKFEDEGRERGGWGARPSPPASRRSRRAL